MNEIDVVAFLPGNSETSGAVGERPHEARDLPIGQCRLSDVQIVLQRLKAFLDANEVGLRGVDLSLEFASFHFKFTLPILDMVQPLIYT